MFYMPLSPKYWKLYIGKVIIQVKKVFIAKTPSNVFHDYYNTIILISSPANSYELEMNISMQIGKN